jgi:hypothetical protein
MRQISLALVAASTVVLSVLAVSALPAAAAGQKSPSGVTKHQSQTGSVDLSARRYYRGRYYRYGYYRPYYPPYYRPYPYYGYGPYYGYYRPAPFPFFPFF